MQVRKGVRRIGALMLVLLATGAMADTPGAVEVLAGGPGRDPQSA